MECPWDCRIVCSRPIFPAPYFFRVRHSTSHLHQYASLARRSTSLDSRRTYGRSRTCLHRVAQELIHTLVIIVCSVWRSDVDYGCISNDRGSSCAIRVLESGDRLFTRLSAVQRLQSRSRSPDFNQRVVEYVFHPTRVLYQRPSLPMVTVCRRRTRVRERLGYRPSNLLHLAF